MPVHTSASYLMYEARKLLPNQPQPKPCQLCDFKFEISDSFLLWLMEPNRFGAPFIQKSLLQDLLQRTRQERLPLLKNYWEALGFRPPLILDSHTRNGVTAVDFNLDLRLHPGIHEQFDLVDNPGTTEHIFDQRAIFENIHNLCRVGGLMSHRIPMYGILNITLYGITPRFLYDLARANRYQIERLWIANRWGDAVPAQLENNQLLEVFKNKLPTQPGLCRGLSDGDLKKQDYLPEKKIPAEYALPDSLDLKTFLAKAPIMDMSNILSRTCHSLILRGNRFRPNNSGEIYSFAIFRKVHDEPFRVPYQGNNLADIEDPEMKQRYRYQMEP
jgi:hypothetical protein